ncbi:MAG: hypothetical protein KDC79_09080 [Cyclobacteriaceae bacterium]|nr:hypothetical protein [Cyclobacteriaceae bacterium]
MKYLIILPLVFLYSIGFSQERELLVGSWKLKSYDAIAKIRLSPGYVFGDSVSVAQIENQFKKTLDSTTYIFGKDSLTYASLEGSNIVNRQALWELKENTICIKETERNYLREAHLFMVNKDSLIIAPIVDGQIGSSKMLFIRDSK